MTMRLFRLSRSSGYWFACMSFLFICCGNALGETNTSYWPKVRSVNAFYNANYEVVDDSELWGVSDYWAAPFEFEQKKAGDCEDFVIAKYFSLVEKGVPKHALVLSYVMLEENQPHMVLLYRENTDEVLYVLDSVVHEIKALSSRIDLRIVYTFNELGVWVPNGEVQGTFVGPPSNLSKWQQVLKKVENH